MGVFPICWVIVSITTGGILGCVRVDMAERFRRSVSKSERNFLKEELDRVCKDSEDDFEELLKIIKIPASLFELTSDERV